MWNWQDAGSRGQQVAMTRGVDGRLWLRVLQLHVLDQDGCYLAVRHADGPAADFMAPIEGTQPRGLNPTKAALQLAEGNGFLQLCTEVTLVGGAFPQSAFSQRAEKQGVSSPAGDDTRATFRYEFPGGDVKGVAGVEMQPFLLLAFSERKSFEVSAVSPVTFKPVNLVAKFESLSCFNLHTAPERRTAMRNVVASVFHLTMSRIKRNDAGFPRRIVDQDLFNARQSGAERKTPFKRAAAETHVAGDEPLPWEVVRGQDGKLWRRSVQLFIMNERGEFLGFQPVGRCNADFRQCVQGGIDRGETYLQALAREMNEEAGLTFNEDVELLCEVLSFGLSGSTEAEEEVMRNDKGETLDERRIDFRYASKSWRKQGIYGQELYPVLLFMHSAKKSKVTVKPKDQSVYQEFVKSFWLPLSDFVDCSPPSKRLVMERVVSAVYDTVCQCIAERDPSDGRIPAAILGAERIVDSDYFQRISGRAGLSDHLTA